MRSDESGWTLIELMIVCLIAIIVMGVPLTLSTQSVVHQNAATSRSAATNRTEVGVAKFLHDLRHAVSPSTVTSTGATLTLPIRSASGGTPLTQQVTWTCASNSSCTRRIGAGSADMVIPYVVSGTFAATSTTGSTTLPQTDPAYVSLTVSVFVSNEQNAVAHSTAVPGASHAITVTDGAALRNFTT
ncbi:MAG: hypothetical protein QOJ89_4236 [bacterium]